MKLNCKIADREDYEGIELLKKKLIDETNFFITSSDEYEFNLDESILRNDTIKKNGGATFVVKKDSKVVAFLFVSRSNRKKLSHIATIGMGVEPSLQNQGIGTLLLQETIKWAESNKSIRKISLGVLSNNIKAISLYNKFGFLVEGIKVNEVKIPEKGYVDDILMYKSI